MRGAAAGASSHVRWRPAKVVKSVRAAAVKAAARLFVHRSCLGVADRAGMKKP
jgi:hypothetical protein